MYVIDALVKQTQNTGNSAEKINFACVRALYISCDY